MAKEDKEKTKDAKQKSKEAKEKLKKESAKSKSKKKHKSAPSKIQSSKKTTDTSTGSEGVEPAAVKIKTRAKTSVKKSKSASGHAATNDPDSTDISLKKTKTSKPSVKHAGAPPRNPAQLASNKKTISAEKNPDAKSVLNIQGGGVALRAAKTAVHASSTTKSDVVQPSTGTGAAAARRISGKTTTTTTASTKSASTAKSATDKPAARLRTPGKHRTHGTGSNARSGQHQTSAGNNETTTLSARSRSNLLTARSHRSSLSSYGHGESTVSPYGDVRTMVCDVSPVPSDVESIDFSSNTGRSQALRVSRETDNPTFNSIAKKQMYKDDSPKAARKSAYKISSNTDNAGSEQTGGTDHQKKSDESSTNASGKNDVVVRIVPDSAKDKSPTSASQKGDVKKAGSKAGQPQSTKSEEKNSKAKGGATRPPPGQPSKQPTAPNKFVRNTAIIKTTLAVRNVTDKDGQKKTKPDSESQDTLDDTADKTKDDENVQDKSTEASVSLETSTGTSKPPDDHQFPDIAEIGTFGSTNIRIPADEECCKAYTVLNNRGFKISLHTIRKALLTPSEYRMLISGSRNASEYCHLIDKQ